jgi:hypothetical protein
MLNVVMLSVAFHLSLLVMLNVIMLNVVMLTVVVLNDIILSVVVLNVVKLSVGAPVKMPVEKTAFEKIIFGKISRSPNQQFSLYGVNYNKTWREFSNQVSAGMFSPKFHDLFRQRK